MITEKKERKKTGETLQRKINSAERRIMVSRISGYCSTQWKVNHAVVAFAKVGCLECLGITNIVDHLGQDNDG